MKPSLVSVVRQRVSYDPSFVRSSVIAVVGQLGLSWGDTVRPGDRVLLKPNYIQESHTERPDERNKLSSNIQVSKRRLARLGAPDTVRLPVLTEGMLVTRLMRIQLTLDREHNFRHIGV